MCALDLAVEMIFPVILGALVWLGIYVRDAELRKLIPLDANDGLPRSDQTGSDFKLRFRARRCRYLG